MKVKCLYSTKSKLRKFFANHQNWFKFIFDEKCDSDEILVCSEQQKNERLLNTLANFFKINR